MVRGFHVGGSITSWSVQPEQDVSAEVMLVSIDRLGCSSKQATRNGHPERATLMKLEGYKFTTVMVIARDKKQPEV